jgi:cold shock CspA family protein
MATGTIKLLQARRGIGFITPDVVIGRSTLVFFRRADVADGGYDALAVGQRVRFAAGPDTHHPYRPGTDVTPARDESGPT